MCAAKVSRSRVNKRVNPPRSRSKSTQILTIPPEITLLLNCRSKVSEDRLPCHIPSCPPPMSHPFVSSFLSSHPVSWQSSDIMTGVAASQRSPIWTDFFITINSAQGTPLVTVSCTINSYCSQGFVLIIIQSTVSVQRLYYLISRSTLKK